MNNKLQIFANEQFGSVRIIIIESEPWFVGKDVATILGYKDTSDALKKHVDAEDKLTGRFADSGQNREMYIINESGLYSLILSSKLPQAKEFKRWVTSEVLPKIPKHGVWRTTWNPTWQAGHSGPHLAASDAHGAPHLRKSPNP